MNDEFFKAIDLKKNDEQQNNIEYGKHKLNEKNYNFNQFNNWIKKKNFNEKPKPIINNKSNYNLVCYETWVETKNFNENVRYYKRNNDHNVKILNNNCESARLKIYTMLIIDIFTLYHKYFFLYWQF